jgi:hypothetical protein
LCRSNLVTPKQSYCLCRSGVVHQSMYSCQGPIASRRKSKNRAQMYVKMLRSAFRVSPIVLFDQVWQNVEDNSAHRTPGNVMRLWNGPAQRHLYDSLAGIRRKRTSWRMPPRTSAAGCRYLAPRRLLGRYRTPWVPPASQSFWDADTASIGISH